MKKADLLIRRYLDNLYTKQEAFKLMNEIHSSKHDNALKTFAGKSSVSCPLKPSDSAPLKHSTMPP